MLNFIIGVIIIIFVLSYFEKMIEKKKIKFLENKFFFTLCESLLYCMGTFFIFESIVVGIGTAIIVVFFRIIFYGLKKYY